MNQSKPIHIILFVVWTAATLIMSSATFLVWLATDNDLRFDWFPLTMLGASLMGILAIPAMAVVLFSKTRRFDLPATNIITLSLASLLYLAGVDLYVYFAFDKPGIGQAIITLIVFALQFWVFHISRTVRSTR